MTLPTNDDFANCELSVEELEAIAAGWPHWLKTVVNDTLLVIAGGAALFGLGGAIFNYPRPPMYYNPTTGTYSV